MTKVEAKPDVWMPMFWGKFFLDTTNFDAERTGAYAALLGHCWVRGGSLPDDDEQLARWARVTPGRWKKHREVLGREPYFRVVDGKWTQKRLTAVLEQQTVRLQTKIDNGKKGGRPKKLIESEQEPVGFDSLNRSGTRSGKRTKTYTDTELRPKEEAPSENQNLGDANASLVGLPPDDGPQRQAVNGHKRDEVRRQRAAEAVALLSFLNDKAGKAFQPVKANIDPIVARLGENVTATQVRQVIAMKAREWKDDPEMRRYLRPETLFNRTKFAGYVGELVDVPEDAALAEGST